MVSWRGRENGGLALQVCGHWSVRLGGIQEPCPASGGRLYIPPDCFIVVSCLPSAGMAATAGADLRGRAAAETTDRARDGGGRAREAHICLETPFFLGLSVAGVGAHLPPVLLGAEVCSCFTRRPIRFRLRLELPCLCHPCH